MILGILATILLGVDLFFRSESRSFPIISDGEDHAFSDLFWLASLEEQTMLISGEGKNPF
jgi:hypothetical protein